MQTIHLQIIYVHPINYVQTNDWCLNELLIIKCNVWKIQLS